MPEKQLDPQFQALATEADEPSSLVELKFKDWYVQKFAVPDLKVHLHYEAIYADMAEAFAAGYRACEEASVSSTDNRKLAQAEVMARTVRS